MELRIAIKYAQLVAYVFGIFGSLLIIVIMIRPTFRKMPKSRICLTLAIIDLSFLIYVFCTSLYEILNGVSPLLDNVILCRLNIPLTGFLTHMDAFLVIFLTTERLLAVIKPFHVNMIITIPRVKSIIAILAVLFFIFDGEVYFRTDLYYRKIPKLNSSIPICKFIADKPVYGLPPRQLKMKDLASVLLRSLIPIVVLIPSNLIIIITLFRQKWARMNMTNTSNQHLDKTSKITWMIVCASVGFIITVTPISIAQLLIRRERFATDPIILITGFIYRLNPTINFYIYFLSGSLFREELKNWVLSFKRN